MPQGPDHNLLFGIIALQMDFVQREQLVAATSAWLTDKSRGLDEILVEHGALKESDRDLLAPLVARHLENHDGDAARSLAALSSIGSVADDLRSLGDENLDATLSVVPPVSGSSDAGAAPAVAGPRNDSGSRFRVLRPHAKGGLGEVSLAQDTEVNREVALKEILPEYADDAQSQARFTLEAEITGGLEHPGVVPVYGLGRYDNGRPFYAMRFVKGDSLQEASQTMHESGSVDYNSVEFRKLLGRFIDVCEAIEYAHSRGVLHRDLKPGNIMLGKYGETLVVDWGLAKLKGRDDVANAGDEQTLRPSSGSGATPTQMGSAIGTPAFMPPEQAIGALEQLGPASDVYSLGATLYYVLTAQRPFAAPKLADVLDAVKKGDFPSPRTVKPAIPKPLEAVCLKAMSLKPDERYASPIQMADDVQRWLGDEPVSAYAEPLAARAQRWVRRHQTLAAAFTALLLAGLAALAVSTVLIGKAQKETADALVKEKAARTEADTQRDIADRKREEADEQRAEANKQRAEAEAQRELAQEALLKNRRISANLAFDRAQRLSEEGRPDVGLNWYVRAMELAPEQDEAFHDLVRANLAEWQSETFAVKEQFLLDGGGYVDTARLSRDGASLYLFRPSTGVIQWDLATVKPRFLTLPGAEATFDTPGGKLVAPAPFALAPDETVCVAGDGKTVYFWNVGDGVLLGDPVAFESVVTTADFHPDGKTLAVGCKDGKCFLLDVESQEAKGEPLAHGAELRVVAFRPDGKVLMTGGLDSTVRRWDLTSRKELQPAFQHNAIGITSAAWSPDGKRIVSADIKTLKIWDVASGEAVLSTEANGGVYAIRFSGDGRRLALGIGDSTVRFFNAETLSPLYHPLEQENPVHFLAFEKSGRGLISIGETATLRRWELPAPLPAKTIRLTSHNRMDIDPAGDVVAYAGLKGVMVLFDTKSGERIGEVNYQEPISSVTFSKDGDRILITGFRGSSRVYLTAGLEQVGKTISFKGMIMDGDFVDDEQIAVSAMQQGIIRVYNFMTGEAVGSEIEQFTAGKLDVLSGKMAVGGFGGDIRTWDLTSREELTPAIPYGAAVVSLQFSPDGSRFAAGGLGRDATIWDASSGKTIATLPHASMIEDLHFSPDSRLLVTAAQDDVVRIWHLATAKRVGPGKPILNLAKVRFDQRNRLHFVGQDTSAANQFQMYIWSRPAQLKGNVETLKLWAAAKTGLELQSDGNHRILPRNDWNDMVKELNKLPPVVED